MAIADYNAALHLDPNNSCVLDSLAWLWSTCPDERFRDGTRAVQFAIRACELDRWQNGNDLAVLAAAYAEAGDFDTAVDWLAKAFEVVPDDASFQARNLPKLELFKACKPFRQEVKTNHAVRVPTETSLITP